MATSCPLRCAARSRLRASGRPRIAVAKLRPPPLSQWAPLASQTTESFAPSFATRKLMATSCPFDGRVRSRLGTPGRPRIAVRRFLASSPSRRASLPARRFSSFAPSFAIRQAPPESCRISSAIRSLRGASHTPRPVAGWLWAVSSAPSIYVRDRRLGHRRERGRSGSGPIAFQVTDNRRQTRPCPAETSSMRVRTKSAR
jgi:hypothetical protein